MNGLTRMNSSAQNDSKCLEILPGYCLQTIPKVNATHPKYVLRKRCGTAKLVGLTYHLSVVHVSSVTHPSFLEKILSFIEGSTPSQSIRWLGNSKWLQTAPHSIGNKKREYDIGNIHQNMGTPNASSLARSLTTVLAIRIGSQLELD